MAPFLVDGENFGRFGGSFDRVEIGTGDNHGICSTVLKYEMDMSRYQYGK